MAALYWRQRGTPGNGVRDERGCGRGGQRKEVLLFGNRSRLVDEDLSVVVLEGKFEGLLVFAASCLENGV